MFNYSYFPVIESERLLFRKLTDDDTQAIYNIFSNPEVLRHIEPEPPVTNLEAAKSLIGWFNSLFDGEHGWRWAIVLKETGMLIGTCGFFHWEQDHQRATIGYDFAHAYWGKGYATETAKRMVQFGFDDMDLYRIEADCNECNIGSGRVLEKAGFTFEGLRRDCEIEKGVRISLKYYGILRPEYEQNQ